MVDIICWTNVCPLFQSFEETKFYTSIDVYVQSICKQNFHSNLASNIPSSMWERNLLKLYVQLSVCLAIKLEIALGTVVFQIVLVLSVICSFKIIYNPTFMPFGMTVEWDLVPRSLSAGLASYFLLH